MRIVSLAPNQTEILAALDLRAHLAGVTENCDHPPWVQSLPRFGTWYAPDLPAVLQARPDLACTFGSHQEEAASLLREAGLRVFHGDPATVDQALKSMEDLAREANRKREGEILLKELESRLEKVRRRLENIPGKSRPTVLRIMHWSPFISVGPGAFQHDVIERAGGVNITADGEKPYFVCDPATARQRDPQVVFFCEPSIGERLREDPHWREARAVRRERLFLFDCGLTCRAGPRIADMVEQLSAVLHPFTRPAPTAWLGARSGPSE